MNTSHRIGVFISDIEELVETTIVPVVATITPGTPRGTPVSRGFEYPQIDADPGSVFTR
jgi:hypothetical protein